MNKKKKKKCEPTSILHDIRDAFAALFVSINKSFGEKKKRWNLHTGNADFYETFRSGGRKRIDYKIIIRKNGSGFGYMNASTIHKLAR